MIPLVAHASTPCDGIAVVAAVERDGAVLRLSYRLDGALTRVVVPAIGAPRRADRLWEHTCFEAFVGPVGSPAYVELNVAPSRAWAVYGFSAHRVAADPPAVVPAVTIRRAVDRIEADVALALPAALGGGALRVGLSAVVELVGVGATYWAIRHPAGRPDFHHADAFALVC